MSKKGSFNYEDMLFGRKEELALSPFYPGYFHLSNALSGLKTVKGKVLDVGCGRGAASKAIKKYRPDLAIWGIDVSEASLTQAREDPYGVNFVYGSAYEIPFEDSSFDAVVTFDMMEHLVEPARAIKEFKRVIKPDGILVLSCPTEGNITTLHGILWRVFGINLKEKYVGHLQMYTFGQLQKLLEKEGFKIVGSRWSNYLYNQLVDLGYFIFLYLQRKDPEELLVKQSTKACLSARQEKPKSFQTLRGSLIKFATFLNFLESKALSFIPGQTIHITAYCRKIM